MILAFIFYLAYIENKSFKTIPLVGELKKIVFVCDSMVSGGAEKVIASISREMANLGIKITIVGVADYHKPHSFYELGQDVVYQTIRTKKEKRVSFLKRVFLLKRLLSDLKPDIVISFLPNANVFTWLALIGLQIPHVVSERNNPYIDPKSKLLRVLKRISFLRANGCVFQTNGAKSFYCKAVQNKSIIIKNPIDFDIPFLKCPEQRNKTVLAVGRLIEQKNYFCLLEAFAIFNKKNRYEYTLKIYGDGPDKNDLIKRCQNLNLLDYVIFAGEDNNWHDKEKNDAMFILSSNYEGMPNSLAEAMAIGIPSISTDCPTGGSKELIKDGVNGFLVPMNDSQSLAKKMIELSMMPPNIFWDSNKEMKEEYSTDKITQRWIEYLLSLKRYIYE